LTSNLLGEAYTVTPRIGLSIPQSSNGPGIELFPPV